MLAYNPSLRYIGVRKIYATSLANHVYLMHNVSHIVIGIPALLVIVSTLKPQVCIVFTVSPNFSL